MTAADVLGRLQRHYIKPSEPLPGGVFLTEVNAPAAPRRIDALYMGFTASRGHHIHGHEIKVKRSDWQAELDTPAKADAWWRHCHYWWVVAAPGVVLPTELPTGWGLMIPGKSRVRLEVLVKPDKHEPELSLALLLELMKKLDTMRYQAEVEARQEISQKVQEEVALIREQRAARMDPHAAEALEFVRELSKRTGVHLPGAGYSGKRKYFPNNLVMDTVVELLSPELDRRKLLVEADTLLGKIVNTCGDLAALAKAARI